MSAAAPAGLAGDARGTSLIEFALVMPILLTLFVAAYQLSDMIFVYRKVTVTTRTIADLTAQAQIVAPADLDTILAASQQVIAPFDAARGTYLVSQISVDAGGIATVAWSRGRNVTPLVKGSRYDLPATIRQAGTSIVIADVAYRYVPAFATAIIGSFTLKDTSMMWPRRTGSIPCAAC